MLFCIYNLRDDDRQMKQRKRVSGGGTIARLEATWYRPAKLQVSVRLDADVLAWFKRGGPGYQTRINAALREVMREEQDKISQEESGGNMFAYSSGPRQS